MDQDFHHGKNLADGSGVGQEREMPLPDMHSEEFLRMLMKRQLRLSVSIGLVFGLVLVLLPLLNYFKPEFMAQRVGGFTLSWLILGVLVFPLVWVLSWIFIRQSTRLENEEVESVRKDPPPVTEDR